MASYDRKFEVTYPTLDKLSRMPLEVETPGLLNPQGTNPVPLIDGEMVFMGVTGKYIRALVNTAPCWPTIEDRGDYGVQASRKLSVLIGPPSYVANTIVFTPNVNLILGANLMLDPAVNDVTTGSVVRSGLKLWDGGATHLRLGFIIKVPAINRNLLQYISAVC